MEAVRRRFADLGLRPPEERGKPVIALIFAGREGLSPYTAADARDPGLTRGLSLPGEDHRWIAIAWDAPGDPLTALTHEYAHLLRPDSSDPLWFREGLAEYLSGLPPGKKGAEPGWAAGYHLRALREQAWIGWEELLTADRMSAAFARPGFYSQAWLAVSWLVAHDRAQGIDLAQVRPADLESIAHTRGTPWLDAQLRSYAEQLLPKDAPDPEPTSSDPEAVVAAQAPAAQPLEGWELPYWKAEFQRELHHWDTARAALESLERDYPEIPQPSAAWGALAIAEGRYAEAEEKLAAAVRKGSRDAATHHRYSLMLLRPIDNELEAASANSGDTALDRAKQAVRQAQLAREADPDEPRYLLGEAQALLVAGQWDAAARLLVDLQSVPGWAGKSDEQFAELLRRRQQAMRRVAAPRFAIEANPPAAETAVVAALAAGSLGAAAQCHSPTKAAGARSTEIHLAAARHSAALRLHQRRGMPSARKNRYGANSHGLRCGFESGPRVRQSSTIRLRGGPNCPVACEGAK